MRSRARHVTLALAAVLAWSGTAGAETVRLSWQAPSDCPGKARFMAEVRARTPNAEFSDTAAQARLFGVTLTRSEQHYAGQLQIQQESGGASTRSFDGDTCAEVVSALALLTALAIDPNASGAATIEVPPTPAPEPTVSKPPEPAHKPLPRPLTPEPATRTFPWHMAAGGQLAFAGWIAPSLLPGFGLFGEAWQERPGLFSPGFRLGLRMDWDHGQAARWQWYAARLEACPVRVPIGWKLASQTCAGADVGAVHGQGVTIDAPHASTRLWVAATLQTGLVLESGSFFAGIHGGIVAPITRYRFFFENPRIDLHQIPYVGATMAVGAGVRFF